MFSVNCFIHMFSQFLGKWLLSFWEPKGQFICCVKAHSHVLCQSLKSSVVSIVVVMGFANVLFSFIIGKDCSHILWFQGL